MVSSSPSLYPTTVSQGGKKKRKKMSDHSVTTSILDLSGLDLLLGVITEHRNGYRELVYERSEMTNIG